MSQKQDKARIYNSKEWRDIRNAKKQRNPLCELCLEEGITKAADCVHHVIPIETANNFAQMKEIAFRFSNLQSLCYAHHSAVHQQLRSRSKEGHLAKVRAEEGTVGSEPASGPWGSLMAHERLHSRQSGWSWWELRCCSGPC